MRVLKVEILGIQKVTTVEIVMSEDRKSCNYGNKFFTFHRLILQ